MKGTLGILGSLFTLSGTILLFAVMVQKSDTQAVSREIGTATERMEKQPVGIKRAELFIQDLKKIDPRYAPVTVKRALKDYIDALEQGLTDFKAGNQTKADDAKIGETSDKLKETLKEQGS